jgi:hypothetical protein
VRGLRSGHSRGSYPCREGFRLTGPCNGASFCCCPHGRFLPYGVAFYRKHVVLSRSALSAVDVVWLDFDGIQVSVSRGAVRCGRAVPAVVTRALYPMLTHPPRPPCRRRALFGGTASCWAVIPAVTRRRGTSCRPCRRRTRTTCLPSTWMPQSQTAGGMTEAASIATSGSTPHRACTSVRTAPTCLLP